MFYFGRCLAVLALLGNIGSAVAQENVSQRSNDIVSDREIVVVGRRSGEIFTEVLPIDEIDENEIGAFASGSITELLGALTPQTKGSAGTGPIILVNGKRVGSPAEVSNLPPEALVKIQIFPEQLAQSLGVSADKRVVNLVLKKDFRAITGQIEGKFPTAGAGNEYQARIDLARIEDNRRWNVSAQYTRREAVSESDRTVIGGRGKLQTLIPKTERIGLSGNWSDYAFNDVQLEVSASINAGQSVSRIANRSLISSDPPFYLNRRENRTANVAVSGNGQLGSWDWFASGSVDWSYSANHIDRRNQFHRTEGRTTNFRGSALFNGNVTNLPAGSISASVELSALKETTDGNSNIDGAVTHTKVGRTSGGAKATLAIPLTGQSFFGSIGRLTANFEGGVESVSNLSSLIDYGYGLRWAPHPAFQLSVFWSRNENAPSASDLSDPRTLTPNVTVFDFVRGESVEVDLLSGGNASLSPETARSFRLSLSIRPEDWSDFSFNASYSRRRVEGAIGPIPAISSELANVFPDRFIRDQIGRLQTFDARPVNLGRSRRESANWTLSWSKQLNHKNLDQGSRPGDKLGDNSQVSSGVILFSIDHRVMLRDQRELLPGGPPIDFLHGSAGGASKHNLEFNARAVYRGVGLNLNANWASSYNERASNRELKYSASTRFDVKLFANLDQIFSRNEKPHWSNGLRASLTVENLFNNRRKVVDQNDNTPLALQPSYLDPLGRTIQFTIRKVF